MKKNKILFFPLHQTSWDGMFPIIKDLGKKNKFIVEILVCNRYIYNKSREHPKIANYITLYDDNSLKKLKHRTIKFIKTFWNYFYNKINTIDYFPALIDNINLCVKQLNSTLSYEQYLSAVIYTDRTIDNGYTPALLKVLSENYIPIIMPPIAESSIFLRKRRKDVNYDADDYPGLMKAYPKSFIFDIQTGKNIFFYRIKEMNSLIKLGLIPDNPWINGGGRCTKVLLGSEMGKNHYKKKGVDVQKLIVTGQRSHDNIFNTFSNKENIKLNIFRMYGLKTDTKIMILSVPPLFDEGMSEQRTKKEYSFLFTSLRKLNAMTLLSLHPRISKPFVSSLIGESKNVIIIEERLHNIIPISDIFLCCGSSTIVWSLISKVPVINFDFYNYKFVERDYDEYTNRIQNKSELIPLINKLLFDFDYNASEIKRISAISKLLSPFDGKCGKRIISEIINP